MRDKYANELYYELDQPEINMLMSYMTSSTNYIYIC